jgi:hypothetical protein
MSGRINDLRGRKRPNRKAPGAKPNSPRLQVLAARRRKKALASDRLALLKAAALKKDLES